MNAAPISRLICVSLMPRDRFIGWISNGSAVRSMNATALTKQSVAAIHQCARVGAIESVCTFVSIYVVSQSVSACGGMKPLSVSRWGRCAYDRVEARRRLELEHVSAFLEYVKTDPRRRFAQRQRVLIDRRKRVARACQHVDWAGNLADER